MNPPVVLPDGTYRATAAVVDLDAIDHNLLAVRKRIPSSVEICAVVKADAYGHGAVPVSRTLEARGVEAFGVATVEEGIELREAGIRRPILLLGASSPGVEILRRYRLTPVIHSEEAAKRLLEETRAASGPPLPVHLKVDTGMGRLGILRDRWEAIVEALARGPGIRIEGIASHFSSAESDPGYTLGQIGRFDAAVEAARRHLGPGRLRLHIANSAGILNHPSRLYDLVRPGLVLYGVHPAPGLRERIDLRPAMTFQSRILAVRTLPEGSPISYGRTFRTRRRSRIAVLPVGYADGYRRDLSNRAHVLVRGVEAPVVGNITMDLTLADVTDIPGAGEGDEVILFGTSPTGNLPAEDLAERVGTIPYEILCGVGRRVPRLYRRGGRIVKAP